MNQEDEVGVGEQRRARMDWDQQRPRGADGKKKKLPAEMWRRGSDVA